MNDKNDDMNLIHRDDVPMDVAEHIVKELKERHPGARISFTGDEPVDSPDVEKVQNLAKQLRQKMAEKFLAGECWDCGVKIPQPWPPENDDEDGFLPDGWQIWRTEPIDEWPPLFQCPACNKEKEADDEKS